MPQYVDYAEYYDFGHDITIDIEFYIGYARQCGSPILELACGTGRVLIPLAEAGFHVHGLDLSNNMLSLCQQKVSNLGLDTRVHLTLANMASFDLECKNFALAYIPARSFMHLFTQEEQISCLRQTYTHLCPGGCFIVDVYAPNFGILAFGYGA